MPSFTPFPHPYLARFAALFLLLPSFGCKPDVAPIDPILGTPSLAIETQRTPLGSGPVFTAPSAAFALKGTAPELLPGSTTDGAFQSALSDPLLWRKLDRKHRFTAVLLSGSPDNYQRLARYLIRSTDWSLAYLDHASMIFQRTPKSSWTPDALKTLDERFANLPKNEHSLYRTSLASTLRAAGFSREAESYLDRTIENDPTYAAAHLQLAILHADRKKWAKALTEADLALETAPDLERATAVKAEALLSLGRPAEAYPLTQQLMRTHGDSVPTILFLHAKVAHGVHDYEAEITALTQLITLAEASDISTSTYRTYLGQAYSANRAPAKALAEFEALLATPNLPPAEREFVEKAVERLRNSKKLF